MHPETKSDLINIAKNLAILFVAVAVLPYLFAVQQWDQFLPHIPSSAVMYLVLAIPALFVGWVALHIGLFIFKTLFPR